MTIEIASNTDPKIIRVFIIRHGQTDHNVKKILQGHLDIDINETGLRQAKLVGGVFKSIKLDTFITSDLIRCQNTTNEIVKFHPTVNLKVTSNLRERNMGIVQGMYIKDAIERYGTDFRQMGESGQAFLSRIESEWEQTLKTSIQNDYLNIGLCSHGGVITAFVNHLYKSKNYKLNKHLIPESLKVPFNTSVSVIDFVKSTGEGVIQAFGNTDHLGGHFEVKEQLLR